MIRNICSRNSEPKITYFIDSIFVENVSWLNISMDEALVVNVVISLDNLAEDLN